MLNLIHLKLCLWVQFWTWNSHFKEICFKNSFVHQKKKNNIKPRYNYSFYNSIFKGLIKIRNVSFPKNSSFNTFRKQRMSWINDFKRLLPFLALMQCLENCIH